MESILTAVREGQHDAVLQALLDYNAKNQTSFHLTDDVATREKFCKTILHELSTGQWEGKTQAEALTALRIAAREREGGKILRSVGGLRTVVSLADLSCDIKQSCFHGDTPLAQHRTEVIVEAVKCLCNLVLTDHSLAASCTELGVLHGLSLRLRLVRNVDLPPDILTFDLRLLFLITACGVEERKKFREDYGGLDLLLNIIDMAMIGRGSPSTATPDVAMETTGTAVATERSHDVLQNGGAVAIETQSDETEAVTVEATSTSSTDAEEDHVTSSDSGVPDKYSLPLPPSRSSVNILPTPLSEQCMGWISEAMKIVFNQTAHWKHDGNYDDDELVMFDRVVVLIRIILVSVPFQLNKLTMDTVVHSVEVLVNTPLVCARNLLLPPGVQLMPTLQEHYPSLFQDSQCSGAAVGGSGSAGGSGQMDEVYDGWNTSAVVCLLHLLSHALKTSSSTLPTILSVLRNVSKGHRSIRQFLKSKILPPLHEVTQRPELEGSLKGKLVRLMTAGSQGAEGVAAEFLFVLCKESASRLIKYTGYGNAAGLLFAHGLLDGGRGEGAGDYSSDSEDSDTEEYVHSKPRVDPVTGGPGDEGEGEGEGGGRRGLEGMTDEEKEREAAKLVELMKKLNEQGIIQVMPLDSQQQDLLQTAGTEPLPDLELDLD